jgi:hypothetical protein
VAEEKVEAAGVAEAVAVEEGAGAAQPAGQEELLQPVAAQQEQVLPAHAG